MSMSQPLIARSRSNNDALSSKASLLNSQRRLLNNMPGPATKPPVEFLQAYREYCLQHSLLESRILLASYDASNKRLQVLLDGLKDEQEVEALTALLRKYNLGLAELCITLTAEALKNWSDFTSKLQLMKPGNMTSEAKVKQRKSSAASVSHRHPAVLLKPKLLSPLIKSVAYQISMSGNDLKDLEISGITLKQSMIKQLALGLQNAHQLQRLSFCRSALTDTGLMSLGLTLRQIQSLRYLILSGCQLSRPSARFLLDIIKFRYVTARTNGWMERLRVDEVDAKEVEVRRTVVPIKRLDLSRNFMGNDGGRLLAETLSDQFDLLALDLGFNGITSVPVMKALVELPRENKQILVLDVRNNGQIDKEQRNELHRYLLENANEFLYQNSKCPVKEITDAKYIASALNDKELEWLDERNPFRTGYRTISKENRKISTVLNSTKRNTREKTPRGKQLMGSGEKELKEMELELQKKVISSLMTVQSSVRRIDERVNKLEKEQRKSRQQNDKLEQLLTVMEQSIQTFNDILDRLTK